MKRLKKYFTNSLGDKDKKLVVCTFGIDKMCSVGCQSNILKIKCTGPPKVVFWDYRVFYEA